MRISDWSSDVCSSDLKPHLNQLAGLGELVTALARKRRRNLHRARGDTFGSVVYIRLLRFPHRDHLSLHGCLTCPRASSQDRVCAQRSEEHTSELQSLMRISYAVFCLKKQKHNKTQTNYNL